jgi:hypothetical protein
MLQTVMRPSMESARIASPAYSMTCRCRRGADLADDGEDDVLGGDAFGSWPSTRTSMFLAFCWISVWVASTCSTSDVPMPCASAPKAPCVEVWLSPQTMVMPGRVKPCSGPMMCTMPWRRRARKYFDAEVLGVLRAAPRPGCGFPRS